MRTKDTRITFHIQELKKIIDKHNLNDRDVDLIINGKTDKKYKCSDHFRKHYFILRDLKGIT